ncbi:MAG: hypothetical protein GX275_02445 [Clostridiales bacterium]|nr:hypothetical protein [Clostridiales bacterium]
MFHSLLNLFIFPSGIFAISIILIILIFEKKFEVSLGDNKKIMKEKDISYITKIFKNNKVINAINFICAIFLLLILIFIPMYHNIFTSKNNDLVLVISFFTISIVVLLFKGKNYYINIFKSLLFEIPIIISILTVAVKCNYSLSLYNIEGFQLVNGVNILNLGLIPGAVAFLLALNSINYEKINLLHRYTGVCLFVALFLGGRGLAITGSVFLNNVLNILLYILLVLIVMFILLLLRKYFEKKQIKYKGRLFLGISFILSSISLLLTILY